MHNYVIVTSFQRLRFNFVPVQTTPDIYLQIGTCSKLGNRGTDKLTQNKETKEKRNKTTVLQNMTRILIFSQMSFQSNYVPDSAWDRIQNTFYIL